MIFSHAGPSCRSRAPPGQAAATENRAPWLDSRAPPPQRGIRPFRIPEYLAYAAQRHLALIAPQRLLSPAPSSSCCRYSSRESTEELPISMRASQAKFLQSKKSVVAPLLKDSAQTLRETRLKSFRASLNMRASQAKFIQSKKSARSAAERCNRNSPARTA